MGGAWAPPILLVSPPPSGDTGFIRMAVRIKLAGDTRHETTDRFTPEPIGTPIFLDALQKSG